MDMKVGDALAAVLAVVYDKAEPLISSRKAEFLGDFPGNQQQVAKGFPVIIVSFSNSRDGLLGNDQDVVGGLGINVLECN